MGERLNTRKTFAAIYATLAVAISTSENFRLEIGIGQYEKIKVRTTDYGLRTTDYGLRTTDYGLWTADYGLRTTDYGLVSIKSCFISANTSRDESPTF